MSAAASVTIAEISSRNLRKRRKLQAIVGFLFLVDLGLLFRIFTCGGSLTTKEAGRTTLKAQKKAIHFPTRKFALSA